MQKMNFLGCLIINSFFKIKIYFKNIYLKKFKRKKKIVYQDPTSSQQYKE